ncbi:MAG TPA: thioesterase family protein [Solirubrobacteraceae bacterium]
MSAFTHTLRVRYNECDPQGIVFNANYLTFLDLTVTELWRERVGGYQHFVEETGTDIVVAEASLRFRAAARFDDEIAITLHPELTSESSITTQFTIERDGTRLIEGTIRHVCVDAQALTKVPAPARLRAALDGR